MLLVVLVGLALVLLARDRRTDNIITGNQHWYSSYDFYECDRYLGVFYPAATDADQAIVAEGDGLIHVQPFHGSATSATSSVGGFMAAAGVRITDSSLELPDGRVLRESDAVCAAPDGDGEPGAELRVLRWNNVDAPGAVVFVDDLAGVRLSDNGQVVGFALVHPDLDSADVPLPDTTALREKLDLEPADDG
ncbi:MAG TPA: hypothetical protein DEP66_04795, partial [Acidimicrobiaceae bacterium]|nr:hypothetical protein [Acidimicrobiaceae bacterium]